MLHSYYLDVYKEKKDEISFFIKIKLHYFFAKQYLMDKDSTIDILKELSSFKNTRLREMSELTTYIIHIELREINKLYFQKFQERFLKLLSSHINENKLDGNQDEDNVVSTNNI